MKRKKIQIGLALGGGGARGFAHIGVLRVLEEENIPIDIIVGSSSGALVGASYASGIGPDKLEEIIEDYLESPEFHSSAINAIEEAHSREDSGLAQKIQSYLKNKVILLQAMFKPGLLSVKDFRAMIDYLIPDIRIEDTRIPFRAVATDLVSGKLVIFSEGSLREAVMASSAVPGAIEPLEKDDYLLSDGGIIAHIPVSATRKEGAKRVIAVAVSKDIMLEDELNNAQEILSRANDLTTHYLDNYELTRADVVIRPSVGTLHWSEFSHAQHLIRAGEIAARENIGLIHSITPGIKKW
ncbi:MAG: patatin, partial [Syntrophobacterales bacterium]